MLQGTFHPNQEIKSPFLTSKKVNLYIKRLDLIHPTAGGNKYFKLLYNLKEAEIRPHKTILTFGGAYSNHIYSTAAACQALGLRSIGIIRGEAGKQLSPTLEYAKECGMSLHYMDRETYRNKQQAEVVENLRRQFGSFYLIPEGGTNKLAIKGCMEILREEDHRMDYIGAAIGTGGTLTGLIASARASQTVLGISSLKGEFIHKEIECLLESHAIEPKAKYELFTDYHFGGYAKYKQELIEFMREFTDQNGIPLDPIYTGKLFYGIYDLIKKDYFPEHASILLIHSGGLQGIEGFNMRHQENLRSS